MMMAALWRKTER